MLVLFCQQMQLGFENIIKKTEKKDWFKVDILVLVITREPGPQVGVTILSLQLLQILVEVFLDLHAIAWTLKIYHNF